MSAKYQTRKDRSAFRRYGASILAVLGTLGVALALRPYSYSSPFLFFFYPVLFAIWYGGFWPGTVAAILSSLFANVYLLPPYGHLSLSAADLLRTGFFTAASILIGRVNERAEERRERLRQLEGDLARFERVSTLGELAASISHELKQPITATMTNARGSMRWLKRKDPDLDEVFQAAQRIEKDGARATEIIDRLRAMYKKGPPKREVVDVSEIVGEIVAILRGEANRSSVSIRTDLAADLPRVTADRVQVQQVLMNLMLNGIEAMNETGGGLTISSRAENEHVIISVSDTGVGLPQEKADKIFDAFFTTKPQGSGMGLAISRSIVESHGGRLWATPNDGRGASFHFSLPTASPGPEEARR
jgi:signal transduction histidine kinase